MDIAIVGTVLRYVADNPLNRDFIPYSSIIINDFNIVRVPNIRLCQRYYVRKTQLTQ